MSDDRRSLFEARDAALANVQRLRDELAQAQGELVRANMALNESPTPGRPYAVPVADRCACGHTLDFHYTPLPERQQRPCSLGETDDCGCPDFRDPFADDGDDAFRAEARKAKEAVL